MGLPVDMREPQSGIVKGLADLEIVYTNVYLMVFEWDPLKSDANLRDRGFDFEFAVLVFERALLEKEDRRTTYGEVRMVAIGVADGTHLTVVYTDRPGPRGEKTRRIISARRSNRRERKAYQKNVEG